MEEEEEVYVTIKPRRMGKFNIPLHFLNLAAGVAGCVHSFFADVVYDVAAHSMQHREDLEFGRIVKNYDNPSSIGPGGPESED